MLADVFCILFTFKTKVFVNWNLYAFSFWDGARVIVNANYANPEKPLCICKGKFAYHDPPTYIYITRSLLGLGYANIHQSMSGYFFQSIISHNVNDLDFSPNFFSCNVNVLHSVFFTILRLIFYEVTAWSETGIS